MTLAGKHRTGVLSIGSMSSAGLDALPTQWSFAEESAARHGNTVNRADWRVVMSWHIAETREQARAEAGDGLLRWHNEYNVGTLMRPGMEAFADRELALDEIGDAAGASVIGTPDDLVAAIRRMQDITGGFGTVIGFAHDWANPENTARSWDMVARYVIPEVNGMLDGYRESQRHVIEHRESFDRGVEAIKAKIGENERAVEAMKAGAAAAKQSRPAIAAHHGPDLRSAK